MDFQIGMSRRAYAKRRAVSDKAVRRAIETGRIATAVLSDGTIDSDAAHTPREANIDPTQRRGKEAKRAEASLLAATGPGPPP